MRPEAGPALGANQGTGKRQFHELLKYNKFPPKIQAALRVFSGAISGVPLPAVLRPEELAALVLIGRYVVDVLLLGVRP